MMLLLIVSTDQFIDNIDLNKLSLTVLIVQLVSVLIYIDRTIRNVFVDQRKFRGDLGSRQWLRSYGVSLQGTVSEHLELRQYFTLAWTVCCHDNNSHSLILRCRRTTGMRSSSKSFVTVVATLDIWQLCVFRFPRVGTCGNCANDDCEPCILTFVLLQVNALADFHLKPSTWS